MRHGDKSTLPRGRLMIKLEAIWRRLLLESPSSRWVGSILLNEYPKSGGTWLGQMLSTLVGIPFPRHQFPPLRTCILHGHHVRHFRYPRILVLWRDPRDIMVSWYHHCLFQSERTHPSFVSRVRAELAFQDFHDIRRNLPDFIDYSFNRQQSPRFTWNDFFDAWYGFERGVHARYELLRSDPVSELIRICEALGVHPESAAVKRVVDMFSFERMSGRRPGEEKMGAFLRKGIVGDWKDQFSAEAAATMARHVDNRIVLAGYEQDEEWIKRCALMIRRKG